MDWSCVDYCDFLSAVWTLTAPIRCRASDVMLHFSKSVTTKNSSTSHTGKTHLHIGWLRVSKLSANFHLNILTEKFNAIPKLLNDFLEYVA